MTLLNRDDYSIGLEVDGEPFDLTENGAEHWLLRHLNPSPHKAGVVFWADAAKGMAREHLRQEHVRGQEDDGTPEPPVVA